MAIAQLNVRRWLKVACVLLFVFGVVVPCLLLSLAGSGLDNLPVPDKISPRRHERKPLDYYEDHETADTLKFQISELENIRVSVRNELRVLDHDRQRLSGEVESAREKLGGVKKDIEKAKLELQNTKTKLSRAARQVKKASDCPPRSESPGTVVVVNLPEGEQIAGAKVKGDEPHSKAVTCVTGPFCLDLLRCPLHRPFLVHVYNNHKPYSDLFPLKDVRPLDLLLSRLREEGALTSDPTAACVSLLVTGPLTKPLEQRALEEKIQTLPEWRASHGRNLLLVHLPYLHGGGVGLEGVDCGEAVVAHGVAATSLKQHNTILLPPVTLNDDEPSWQGLPLHLPAKRLNLVYFEGQHSEEKQTSSLLASDLEAVAASIADKTRDNVFIKTSCRSAPIVSAAVLPGEWSLCSEAHERRSLLVSSTFSLVLGGSEGGGGPHTFTRLVEALRYGAIPVIVGVAQLPLDTVLDWSRSAVVLPPSQFSHLHFVLKTFSDERILFLRRQGRFLWETYFCSPARMINSILALVRSIFNHPPPPITEGTKVTHLVSLSGGNRQVRSPSFQNNFTIYSPSLWNSPPGPFYMFPSTPFEISPVSGSQYVGLDEQQLLGLPRHIVEAGGITGPFFEDLLLGNTDEEQFTIVMLTYERNTVLLQALDRLTDLDGLSKVVVVWNNPAPPPSDMQWPDMGVPLEVVSVGRNSLNNRFLPFSFIETEAVLSIDDDVHLRHDEIQFAFRVWREARDQVVGFPGRFHAFDVRHPGRWLYNSNYTCELSMVLTGAAFLHKYYLYLYSQWMPKEVRSIVDNFINCEDIAMNFLVSHISRKPPLKVTSRWTFRCPGCPDTLSTSDEHFNERHVCINKFTEIFGYMPLLYTQFRVDSVLFKTRLPSHLEKCYQYV